MQKTLDNRLTTLPRLRVMIRDVLRVPESEEIDTRTLRALGAVSVQVIALQFSILKATSVELTVAELVGESTVVEIADLIDARRTAEG
ncbi:acyl carrier protein [Catenulispora sp. MAP12-49]|uniref:acyl carrier protein n=1 Tax=Catenulispora sp. MAP12-49 TaxID=3156302 RepID=UPI003519AC8F